MKANHIGIIAKPDTRKTIVYECIHKGDKCLGKFRPTRIGQNNICLVCMSSMNIELPLIKSTRKYFYQSKHDTEH